MSMLATLDPENAVDFIGKKALEQDVPWIEAARDAGAFDFSDNTALAFGVPGDGPVAMIDSLLSFTQGTTTMSGDTDPVYGSLDQSTTLVELSSTDAFRNAYAVVVDGWLEDLDRLYASLASQNGAWIQQKIRQIETTTETVAMKLMVGAVAIDAPDVLESLAKIFPGSLEMSIEPNKMVDRAMESTLSTEVHLTPYGFALQYGRLDCMEAIESLDLQKAPTVGHLEALQSHPLNAAQLHGTMTPLCYPSVYAHAMKVCFERDPDVEKDAILEGAIEALGLDPDLKRYQMWPAYLDLGVYELDAPTAFEQAVVHGHVPIVESFEGKVPWLEMDPDPHSSLLIRVMEEQTQNRMQINHRETVEIMVQMAKKDGELDRVLRVVVQPEVKGMDGGDTACGPVFVAPIGALIEFDHQDVLHELLKHSGIKPTDSPAPGAWTLQKMADERSERISHFFRSYTARCKAHDLIDEIDSSFKKSPVTP